LEKAFFLHQQGMGEEARLQYLQLAQALEEFIGKTFNEWAGTVEREPMKHLEMPLMVKSHYKSGTIDICFAKNLLKLFTEASYWERLRFEVPHYAGEVYHKREELRVLRENVLLIVRDYNHIVGNLLPEERSLFRERIKSLDKKIRPGMTKLTWASKGILEFFVTECCTHATKVSEIINNYKSSNRSIGGSCRQISEMLMVQLDGRKIYEQEEFEVEQIQHSTTVHQRIKDLHAEIIKIMRQTFEVYVHIKMLHSYYIRFRCSGAMVEKFKVTGYATQSVWIVWWKKHLD